MAQPFRYYRNNPAAKTQSLGKTIRSYVSSSSNGTPVIGKATTKSFKSGFEIGLSYLKIVTFPMRPAVSTPTPRPGASRKLFGAQPLKTLPIGLLTPNATSNFCATISQNIFSALSLYRHPQLSPTTLPNSWQPYSRLPVRITSTTWLLTAQKYAPPYSVSKTTALPQTSLPNYSSTAHHATPFWSSFDLFSRMLGLATALQKLGACPSCHVYGSRKAVEKIRQSTEASQSHQVSVNSLFASF